jgi:NAD(P)-dependent dehydrogenase (short-subunit alcohol dehydrogenase family)
MRKPESAEGEAQSAGQTGDADDSAGQNFIDGMGRRSLRTRSRPGAVRLLKAMSDRARIASQASRVGLIARGDTGLEAAAREVEEGGGKALAVSADMADFEQVTQAARQIDETLGPIDVWINVAFASVFAPFAEITADEFRRVTEVSYLGFVDGTKAALSLMLPRDQGTIVQVGSALGSRSIPLQSAYCGAKHAINGFTSMLIFAAVGRSTRRASLTDALAEALFAAAGFRRASAAGIRDDLHC